MRRAGLVEYTVSEAGSADINKSPLNSARTFSVESGKKLMPFGMTKAVRDAAHTRHVSKNARQVRFCSLLRQPYGQPSITVFGFMPPKPHV